MAFVVYVYYRRAVESLHELLLFVYIIEERWRASMAFVVCVYYR